MTTTVDRFVLLLDCTKACVIAGDFQSVRVMLDELMIEAEELPGIGRNQQRDRKVDTNA